MRNSNMLLPEKEHSFLALRYPEYEVAIQWSKKPFEDYKSLAFDYACCGYVLLKEILNEQSDNVKQDCWFFAAIYLTRHSLELGLKALHCRVQPSKRNVQKIFEECGHNLTSLFDAYVAGQEPYLTLDEQEWLAAFLTSLESVDPKSDTFRFPFNAAFLNQFRNKFLNNFGVVQNMFQAVALIEKCLNCGADDAKSKFDDRLVPQFFVFGKNGWGNCYLWQPWGDPGFYPKLAGCLGAADFLFHRCNSILLKNRMFPVLFLLRNALELSIKQLFSIRVEYFASCRAKQGSHRLFRDLWKNVKPFLSRYAQDTSQDLSYLEIVEKNLREVAQIDPNGDAFRYPTSYSLEYLIVNVTIDLKNAYEHMFSLINFFEGCNSILYDVAQYEAEIRSQCGYYEY